MIGGGVGERIQGSGNRFCGVKGDRRREVLGGMGRGVDGVESDRRISRRCGNGFGEEKGDRRREALGITCQVINSISKNVTNFVLNQL